MPLLDYDYDVEYDNYNKTATNGNSYGVRRTSDKTKDQVSRLMMENFDANRAYVYGNTVRKNYVSPVFEEEYDEDEEYEKDAYNEDVRRDFQKRLFDYENTRERRFSITKPVEMKLKEVDEVKLEKRAIKKANRLRRLKILKNTILAIFSFAIIFLICYRASVINEKFNQVEKAKQQLATRKVVNEQLQADIDVQTDLNYIENYAKYQLGMQKPTDSQTVYVNIEKEDKILTPVSIEDDTNKTWYEKLVEEVELAFN